MAAALMTGAERILPLHLILADRDAAGPGTLRLAEIVREEAARGVDPAPARSDSVAP